MEVSELADAVGMPLMEWQKYVLHHGLMVRDDGKLARRTNGVLVARQNGKSHLMRMLLLWSLFVDDQTWLSMAQNRALALEQFEQAVAIVESFDWLRRRVRKLSKTNGKEFIELDTGAKWSVVAATKDGARGYTGNLWIDELRDVTPEAWKAATPVTRTGHKTIWVTSNAGDLHSTVLNELRTRALADSKGTIGWFEWSADPKLHHMNREGWLQANPAIGHLIDLEVIANAAATDPPNAFKTESLCLWVDHIDSAWSPDSFENCAVAGLQLRPDRPTYMSIDVTPDRRRADLIGAQVLDDGRIGFGIMESWTAEYAVDDLKIAGDIAVWAREYETRVIAYDKWSSAAIAQRLASARFPVADTSGVLFAQACDETLAAMDSRRLAHDNSPELVEQFGACARKNASDGGWRVVRRGSSSYISAACAAIMAIHHANKPQAAAEIIF